MEAAAPVSSDASVSTIARWVFRVRVAAAVAIITAGLYYLLDLVGVSRGLGRPLVLTAAAGGVLATLGAVLVVWAGAAVAALIIGRRSPWPALVAVSLALLAITYLGGTMDDWLILQRPIPHQPTAAAYLALLPEYLVLAGMFAGALVIAGVVGQRGERPPAALARASVDLRVASGTMLDGLWALVTAGAIAAAVMMILMGPLLSHTLRGQVVFAVVVGLIAGLAAAKRLTSVEHPVWYALTPLVVGLLGLLYAAARPALPGAYASVDSVPSVALARPLPIEMMTLGVLVVAWSLRDHPAVAGRGVGDAAGSMTSS